ncbi:ABC transporter substrate-binding protein [Verrucosispora sp. WMMA2044]|uniref:ABC transporter substrate-binding protein n=1 Tax=Verrucosispora sioxanthis TaxID=2499994 RepID=A0A6M1L100_9ACTN|nr:MULTISPECIES: ABC transporter substrate-binding protein [Micromonospora]NEE64802.1 ABC transporter substrate-binding protein [Verrucosispora sioxanthis]NGM13912.1 ABC transporter substrate-binding protein [Verrucosispora sioxanthis]WBB49177.1 ABC transporter substrate-binding protein [Verrucosispora sp. WMMA2044]
MRGKFLKVAVAATATAMLATACSGGGDDNNEPAGESGGTLRVYNAEPAFLTPSGGDDEPSLYVIRQLYRGLVKYNAETSAVEMDLAESVDSTDQKLWTIKLKSGYTFDNGEPVNADAFLRSWNYAAYGPNAQNNGYFMKRIAGKADVAPADPDGEGPKEAPKPTAETMSGLKKVDDLTFTVELDAPFSGFPTTIGYPGFFPMAQACVDDIAACNEKPIGNGPYKIDGSWQHNVAINLVRSDSWKGEPGKPDRIEYRIFADIDAGYAAFQAGELDVLYTLPPARYKEAQAQYGDRMYEQPGDSFTYVGMPLYQDTFKDKRIRQALSLSIDRQSIIDAVFDGRFTPASGYVAPTFEGAREGVCKYCTKDVEKAKQLLAEAGGWPAGEKLILWANAGAGHDLWLQAVGDQIKEALGIDYELKVNLQFAEYLETADQKKFTGGFRLGWGPDYPFMETFLYPLYGTGAGSNNSGYSNEAFDNLMKQGDSAESIQAAIPSYQQAEDILGEDLPVIPMWWNKVGAVYSENVDQFVWNAVSDADYGAISLKQN